MIQCFIGLGGNLGDPCAAFRKTLEALSQIEGIEDLQSSRVYRTSPVSEIPQEDYYNAVASFKTTRKPEDLFRILQQVELQVGGVRRESKVRNAPRHLDIDLLFYGDLILNSETLTLPHPRWQERLFVLAPLSELLTTIFTIRIEDAKQQVMNRRQETVTPLSISLPYQRSFIS